MVARTVSCSRGLTRLGGALEDVFIRDWGAEVREEFKVDIGRAKDVVMHFCIAC